MSDDPHEREYAAEAGRMRQLPREQQRAIIGLHRSVADNPEVSEANRQAARERVAALERLLN